MGHGNRAARFLNQASSIGKEQGESDALILKRRAKDDSRRSSGRRGSSVNTVDSLQHIAEFSHVTVVNPVKVTLIRDLSLQVFWRTIAVHALIRLWACWFLLSLSPVPLQSFYFIHRYPADKAALSRDHLVAANRHYYVSWDDCGPARAAPSLFQNMLGLVASFFFLNVRNHNAYEHHGNQV